MLAQRRGANARATTGPEPGITAAKRCPARPGAHLRAGALCRGRGRRSPAPGQARLSLQRQRHAGRRSAAKQTAAAQGLLVMGPDCGTAIVNGVGLGFANGVRSGNIGLVGIVGHRPAARLRIHQLGGGITRATGHRRVT
ncbi:MAG: hypothetical protein R2838_16070 [Caldilineaceae bacterium]